MTMEEVRSARELCRTLRLVGKPKQRDRLLIEGFFMSMELHLANRCTHPGCWI